MRAILKIYKSIIWFMLLFLSVSIISGQEKIQEHKKTELDKNFLVPPIDYLRVIVESSCEILNTNVDSVINIMPGSYLTFKAVIPESSLTETVTWSAGTSSTFFGTGVIIDDNQLIYEAVSNVNPYMASGIDIINVTDGITTISITIIVMEYDAYQSCIGDNEMGVVPGNDGKVTVLPLNSIHFNAYGGTSNYNWQIIENNSIDASLTMLNNSTANYKAGSKDFSIDVIEVSDGISTKRIEVHVNSGKLHGSGHGCFVRKKSYSRD